MYTSHSLIKTPPDDTIIWRYMDFTKFFSLVSTSTLYFPSALQLSNIDPYEGAYAKSNMVQGDKKYRQFQKDRMRRSIFINSWYMNPHESAAMWKIYADTEGGIAIKSTVGRLKQALRKRKKLYHVGKVDATFIGSVDYLDYEVDTISEQNRLAPFLYKRKSFEHENELRMIKWESYEINDPEPKTLPLGIFVPFDLVILIDKIFVAPTTPDWIKSLVEALIAQNSLAKSVIKSSMLDGGLW